MTNNPIYQMYGYIAAEWNIKWHDADTCFNFTITTVFVCIGEIHTK